MARLRGARVSAGNTADVSTLAAVMPRWRAFTRVFDISHSYHTSRPPGGEPGHANEVAVEAEHLAPEQEILQRRSRLHLTIIGVQRMHDRHSSGEKIELPVPGARLSQLPASSALMSHL